MRKSLLAICILIPLIAACDWKSALHWPTGTQIRELYPAFDLGNASVHVLEYSADIDDLIWSVRLAEPNERILADLIENCHEHDLKIDNQTDTGFHATSKGWRFRVHVLQENSIFIVYRTALEREPFFIEEFNEHVDRLANSG